MEDLIKDDTTFELYHNSEGEKLLNNRVLLSYPSEKSSFDVFLGADGDDYSNFNPTDTDKKADTDKKEKPKFDPEKFAGGVTATAGAIDALGSTIQAFKGDGTKSPSRRKQLKEVCGRRPLLRKNRVGAYDECVQRYNATKIGGFETKAPTDNTSESDDISTTKPNNKTTRNIIIGVVVVGVLATALIGYKKGWFVKKAV